MKFRPHCLLLLIICFLAVAAAASQNAPDAVKFQISLDGGKTVYRIGEPVRLVLSYTSDQPNYSVERYYSPRFDDVILSPADGVYSWRYKLDRLYSYDDVSVAQKLSQSPVSIDITINNLVRFDKPGKYKVKVISRRVWDSSKDPSFPSRPIPLVSNEIEFEMKEMSQPEEQAEVKRIADLMDSAKTLPQHQLIKSELDYLTGDASTIEKVSRFLKPPVFGGVGWLDSGVGLNIAKNKKLAIELLEAALRDPNREINEDLIGELVKLRLLMEDELKPSQAVSSEQLRKEREARSLELERAYYGEMLASLPARSGRIQIGTAYRIFTALPKDDTSSAAYNTTKELLMAKFDELKYYEQSALLERFWDKLKTPALIPSLEKILSNKEPEPGWNNRTNAFKRLIEIDQKIARRYIVNEIRDPDSFINPDILKVLDDKFLPETDDALLEQISKLAAADDRRQRVILQFKLLLAARYATAKIYKEMLDIYKKYGVNWGFEQSGPLLAYLVRHNDQEAIPLIEERLTKWGEISGSNIFYHLTGISLPEGLEKIFRQRLESADPEIAATAAYYLSKYPNKENRKLIEKRHEQWLKEWEGRAAELEDPKTNAKIKSQVMLQITLLDSLIMTKQWNLSDTEIYQLKLKCVSQFCRQHFSVRY